MANGSRHSMFVVKEATNGVTPNDPALELVRITGTTLGLSKDSLQSEEIRSDRQISDYRQGSNQVGGDINFELSYGSFDQLLQGVLVSDDWATDTPIAGTDQIKSAQTRSSFTFVRNFADIDGADNPYYIYRGVEINQMQLSVTANAMITGTFSVIGKSQTTAQDLTALGTPTFPAPSTTSPLDSFTGSLNEGGVPVAVITEISLTLQNGIEPRFVVGSKDSIATSLGRSNLTGQVTAFFEDSTLVDKFLNETESSIDFTLPDGAGNEQKFIIPRIKYTGGQPDVSGEGPITLTMPFQALLDATTGTNLLIERTPV
jgi:hypothetical protein